jgi:PPM family protein phosphatase
VPHVPSLSLVSEVRTDAGPRPINEDTAFASSRLAAIADGVGGAAAGEVASRAVIDALIALDKCYVDAPLETALVDAVANGNERIAFIASCRPETAGMGTTLTAVALNDDGAYVVANVGDSRTYLLRDGLLELLTRDESYVQTLVESGKLSLEEARRTPLRSAVLRALDGGAARAPRLSGLPGRSGDRLLLCSDGLTDFVDDEAIARILRNSALRTSADDLIAAALGSGTADNVTVVVADVVPPRGAAEGWVSARAA